jgi:hypothetical protein
LVLDKKILPNKNNRKRLRLDDEDNIEEEDELKSNDSVSDILSPISDEIKNNNDKFAENEDDMPKSFISSIKDIPDKLKNNKENKQENVSVSKPKMELQKYSVSKPNNTTIASSSSKLVPGSKQMGVFYGTAQSMLYLLLL